MGAKNMKLRNKITGIAAAVLLAAGLTVSAAVTVSAAPSAPGFPPGCGTPFTMNNTNGNNYYIGSNDTQAGTAVITVHAPGRTICTDSTGTPGSVYVRYDNGNYMAANNNCNGVTIKSSQLSNGVVWNDIAQGDGSFKFKSQY